MAIVDETTTLHLLLRGILDPVKELAKLAKKKSDVAARILTLEKSMATKNYQVRRFIFIRQTRIQFFPDC